MNSSRILRLFPKEGTKGLKALCKISSAGYNISNGEIYVQRKPKSKNGQFIEAQYLVNLLQKNMLNRNQGLPKRKE